MLIRVEACSVHPPSQLPFVILDSFQKQSYFHLFDLSSERFGTSSTLVISTVLWSYSIFNLSYIKSSTRTNNKKRCILIASFKRFHRYYMTHKIISQVVITGKRPMKQWYLHHSKNSITGKDGLVWPILKSDVIKNKLPSSLSHSIKRTTRRPCTLRYFTSKVLLTFHLVQQPNVFNADRLSNH
jgi:hypothetical protein